MKKLIFAIAAMAAGAVSAAVSFSYQGSLKLATGENIPASQANKTITFKLYDTPTGTDALWGRQIAVHLDANGLFNVELSDGAGSDVAGVKTNDLAWVLADNASHDRALYIGLDVDGSSGEIRPRQKLLHVPTAAFASDVATAKRDFTVSGIATFNGVVNASKGLTVSGAELKAENGLTVSGGGLATMKGLTVSGGALKAQNGLEVSGGTLKIGSLSIDPNGDTAKGVIPRGVIVMWYGDKVPDGWALCDGSNGTPNLKDRFIVGAGGKYGKKDTGGLETVTLTEGQTPLRKHSHDYWGSRYTRMNSDWWTSSKGEDASFYSYIPKEVVANARAHIYETKETENNSAAAHENRPPYYALYFIMKL